MNFLAPLFLAGLAALAIPLLVHLTHKERKEPIVFPSLMFLQRIPFRTQKRQRLRHWLLFALRALAVALLVFAFARPFLKKTGTGDRYGSDVVIVMDRSASMGARGRWERAQQAAKSVMSGLAAGSRVAVMAFDDRTEGLTELLADRAAGEGALASLHPGSGAGRIAPALQAASALLERGGAGGEIVLVSDFQRAGWDGQPANRLPQGITLRTLDVGDTTLVDAAVTGVVLDRQAGADPKTVVTARLAAARGVAREVPVTLTVDERAVQTVTVRVVPGASALATFAALRDPEAPRRARVSIPADDQPADDAWYFVLGPAPRIGVVVVSRGDAAPRDLLYVREALGVAHDPSFPIIARVAGAVRAADLQSASVVLIDDTPFPGGDAGRRILDWARAGGGLLLALGSRGTLPAEVADSLGNGTAVVDRGDLGAALAISDGAHPVFAGWGDRSDLGASRAFRYRRLEKAKSALARYDDGSPALAESKLGEGRVLVWTADLANRWSDVTLRAAFVPLLHGAVKYVARFAPPPAFRLVGAWESGKAGEIAQSPSGVRTAVPSTVGVTLGERGIYTIGQTLVAANVPPVEADPARVAPALLAETVTPEAGTRRTMVAGVEGPADQERGQRLWWYVLASVLLLLAAETAVAHRARGIR